MKIFGFDITRRTEKRTAGLNPYYDISHGIGYVGSDINTKSVSGIASWWRGTQVLSNIVAGLPKHLVKMDSEDRESVNDLPSVPIITDMVNDNLDSYAWHDYIMQCVLNYGNGYSVIHRDSNNNPTHLTPIHPDRVQLKVYGNAVVYEIDNNTSPNMEVLYEDMYHIKGLSHDGYLGVNPVRAHSVSLAATVSAQDYGKNSYDKGFLSNGYLKVDGSLTPEVKKSLKDSWGRNNLGAAKMGTPVLDAGQEYVPIMMSNQDAQYIESRRFQKSEIATILGIPTHLINEMGDAKYNNVENTNTQFVQYTIMSYVHKFEAENKKLVRNDQRNTYRWRYNVNGLMRGDMATRSAFYAQGIQNSWLKPNEARNYEDLAGGINDYMISTNNQVPYSKLDEVLDSKKKISNE